MAKGAVDRESKESSRPGGSVPALKQAERDPGEQIEVGRERAIRQIVDDLEAGRMHHRLEVRPVEEDGVLWRLQPGPSISEPGERAAVEPRDLDDQSAAGPQQVPRGAEAAKGVVVVLQEMPHRHDVEPGAPEVDVVEETVVELGSREERTRRQVLEIQTGRLNAVLVAQPLKK